jgi:hypothetical protein
VQCPTGANPEPFRTRHGENGGVHSGTVSNSFVGIDALVRLPAFEEVWGEFSDWRDVSRTVNWHDFVHAQLVDLRITMNVLDG